MSQLRSYPKIFNLGHKAIEGIFDGPVIVEEKIDGSQFSFGVREKEGDLVCRSKNAHISSDNPPKMFNKAVETVKQLFVSGSLPPGWSYRAEYLSEPKHNTLAYSRVPAHNLILFDVDKGMEDYLSHQHKVQEGLGLGLETVPILYEGVVTLDLLRELLDRESVLGGQKIEGVVIKAYGKYVDGQAMMGKYVSEAFKESHAPDWKLRNPSRGDVVLKLIESLSTEARWRKAIQHLRDGGLIQDSPSDIGAIIREIHRDVEEEEADHIKDVLFKFIWPQIQRGITKGFPNWYKDQLMVKSFDGVSGQDRESYSDTQDRKHYTVDPHLDDDREL